MLHVTVCDDKTADEFLKFAGLTLPEDFEVLSEKCKENFYFHFSDFRTASDQDLQTDLNLKPAQVRRVKLKRTQFISSEN